ncbi:MAG: hypothetical protein N2V78_07805 [Methanophagales archaeon]|nr:hypothetical protein [Methanophagales archaeon]
MNGLNVFLKRILCVVVVAALVLSIGVPGVGVSHPVQKGKGENNAAKMLSLSGEMNELSSNGALKGSIRVVYSGHGFALREDDEFHVLRVHIVRVRHLQPMYVRGLIAKDLSIKEIRAEIEKLRGQYFYRGYLRLGGKHYRLVNMSFDAIETNGNRVFNADIAARLDNTEIIAGHISIAVLRYEGLWIGDGELSMDEGDYTGEYRVLLTVLPSGLRQLQS